MLIGVPPISSAPLVILIYVVLILILASAIASIVMRALPYAVAAFAATLLLVAILYVTIAPLVLFAVQLLIFTVISLLLVFALLRNTSGLEGSTRGFIGSEWIAGAAVSAVVLALICVVAGVTSWPSRMVPQRGILQLPISVAGLLGGEYLVGLAILVVLLATAALGSSLILRGRSTPGPAATSRSSRSAPPRTRRK